MDGKNTGFFPPYRDSDIEKEFHSWKSSIERDTLISYQKKFHYAEKAYIKYVCARSGKLYPKYNYKGKTYHRMKKLKQGGKLGINCTSEIILDHSQKNKVMVKFYPGHYGHGKDMAIAQISSEEQEAVKKLTSQGVPLEKLMDELKGSGVFDKSQVAAIKKRYHNWVKNAYQTDDYNTDISDAECVTRWIRKCCTLDESPILFCHQENMGCSNEKFILVIMTEFQKHIFMSSSKDTICIDVRNRFLNDELIVIMIIDELKSAFPVAFCLTNSLNKDVISQFFLCIKESIGKLEPKYLMTNYRPYIYDSWVQVMGYEPQWLWSRWHLFTTVKAELRRLVKGSVLKRCELFDELEIIIDCQSKSIFSCIFNKFVNKLENDKDLEIFKKWVVKTLCPSFEQWASCYRSEVAGLTSFHLEAMHNVFWYACKLGGKRRKSKFLSVVMTVLKNKIFDRLINSSDNINISLAKNAINICHAKGMSIPDEKITQLSSKLWLIQDEDDEEEFVTQEFNKCPDHCLLKCESCTICVHYFSCSCLHNMIEANICRHIHAVAFRVIDHPCSPMPLENEMSREDCTVVEDTSERYLRLPKGTKYFPAAQSNSNSVPETSISLHDQASNYQNNTNASPSMSKMDLELQSFNKERTKKGKISDEHLIKNGELFPSAGVLQKIMELYNKVQHNDLEPEILTTIETHLNICRDLAATKSSPKIIKYKKKNTESPSKLLDRKRKKEKSFEHPQKRTISTSTDVEQAKRLKVTGGKIIVSSSKPLIKMTVSEFLKNKGILVKKVTHLPSPNIETDFQNHTAKE